MKFYDLEWLAEKCGTDNKYEITARVAAEARREAEEAAIERGNPGNERFISNVLAEIEEGTSPINSGNESKPEEAEPEPELYVQPEPDEQPEPEQPAEETA